MHTRPSRESDNLLGTMPPILVEDWQIPYRRLVKGAKMSALMYRRHRTYTDAELRASGDMGKLWNEGGLMDKVPDPARQVGPDFMHGVDTIMADIAQHRIPQTQSMMPEPKRAVPKSKPQPAAKSEAGQLLQEALSGRK